MEEASIQKTWGKLGTNQQSGLANIIKYLPVRHLLNESQTNLSLSDTTHAIQQKEFSTAEFIIASSRKMFLKFYENVGPACEPIA